MDVNDKHKEVNRLKSSLILNETYTISQRFHSHIACKSAAECWAK